MFLLCLHFFNSLCFHSILKTKILIFRFLLHNFEELALRKFNTSMTIMVLVLALVWVCPIFIDMKSHLENIGSYQSLWSLAMGLVGGCCFSNGLEEKLLEKKGWMKLSKSIELSKFIHCSRILRVSRSQIHFGFLNLSVFFPPWSL